MITNLWMELFQALQGRPRWRGPASSAVYGVGKLVRNMKWETRSGGEGGAEKGSSHIRDFLAAEHFLSTFQMCKRTKFFKGEWTLGVVTTTEHGQCNSVIIWAQEGPPLDPVRVRTLSRGVGGGHWPWSRHHSAWCALHCIDRSKYHQFHIMDRVLSQADQISIKSAALIT